MDSVDAWAHPEAFKFDKDLVPTVVAGCPPDAHSKTGQLWGNPIYDWKAMKKNNYQWWIRRIRRSYELMDVIRIDHFNGFDEYYEVPYGDETAENGKKEKGPGMAFFRALKKELGELEIIAEDLGEITKSSEKLLKDTGFPGMKVLQYAFDWSESSYYLTYKHIKNCVVYTGTHDNTTTRAWIEEIPDHDRDFARRFINSENTDYGRFVWDFIREAYRSCADLCIVPLQDYLVKGKEARINEPGTLGTNWQWRLIPNFLSKDLALSIYGLAKTYGRLPKEPVKTEEEASEKTEK
jgi:4-alpha-glucanotransferase